MIKLGSRCVAVVSVSSDFLAGVISKSEDVGKSCSGWAIVCIGRKPAGQVVQDECLGGP